VKRCAIFIAAWALAVAALSPGERAAAGFCTESTVYDYAAPLAAMPPVPPLTAGRTALPFGPSGLALTYRPAGNVVLPGAESVGFALSTNAGRKAARPGWLVSVRLAKVSETGTTQQVLQTRRAQVGKLAPHSPVRLNLGLSGEPGYYRVEIVFRDRSGKRIGRFGEYIRILAGNLDVRLSLDKSVAHPGETIEPRLENYGAADLSFGLGAPIEVQEGGSWVRAPFGNGPVPMLGLVIGPGQATSCWQRAIPADASPGTYRVSLSFSYQLRTGRLPIGSGETRTVEFKIVPAP
jgi:hypothetical protein